MDKTFSYLETLARKTEKSASEFQKGVQQRWRERILGRLPATRQKE